MGNHIKRLEKKLIKFVINSTNSIYESCEIVATEWDKNCIPLNYLLKAIDFVKTSKLPDELKPWGISVFNMLDILYSTCKVTAKNMNSREIPLKILKQYIDVLQKQYINGAHGK